MSIVSITRWLHKDVLWVLIEYNVYFYPIPDFDRLVCLFVSLFIYYVAAKATYIRLLYGQKWGFSALTP